MRDWTAAVVPSIGRTGRMGKAVSGLSRVPRGDLFKSVNRPEYSVFQLSMEDLRTGRDLARRGIIVAVWLAVKARNELPCFREFIYWLRYGGLCAVFELVEELMIIYPGNRGNEYSFAK